jgi:hypothetical protein
MRWKLSWSITLPGTNPGPLFFDEATASLLVADGWGVSYQSMSMRQVDIRTGRQGATVRTKAALRAVAKGTSQNAFYLLGDKALFIHDGSTLERRAAFDRRVPRYSNQVAEFEAGSVLLGTPSGVRLYELATGKTKRVFSQRAAALLRYGPRVLAVLEDGCIHEYQGRRWQTLSSFEAPIFRAAIDLTRGLVAGLVGPMFSPIGPDGLPVQEYAPPTSSDVCLLALGHESQSRAGKLPLFAQTVGFVGDQVVVAALDEGVTRVASAPLGNAEVTFAAGTLEGSLQGIVDHVGIATSVFRPGTDTCRLSIYTITSTTAAPAAPAAS